ncbi:transcription factor BIM1 isoform X1 [Corylus avellana]|uniref:transcription factor BIM1 isoform X1 n=1 Tax=Corylus avellana TaxID=13451 RepID=UPI00286CE5DC|nr:transcription factor BIM1 isoform X1 [Corylus avellana]XP_059453832.1 transcription factor BIM1 isoform X1 [Corylus avellana]
MELPQPRPFGTEGRKPTHDFLSLYSHSTAQQDPLPASQGGGYPKTHDFLQPLERIGRSSAKEESTVDISTVEKPAPPAAPASEEHILPGGIGTYSISHISYFAHQRVPKPEGSIFTVAQTSSTDRNDENSNCTSYTGSGFTLWEESAALKKGKTGKENMGEKPIVREGGAKLGQWTTSERPSQSSTSNSNNNNHRNSFSSLSSSQAAGQKNKSFMEMIKSAKVGNAEEDDLDYEEEFVLKKEPSTSVTTAHRGELRVKVDGKDSDQKANTPRSKHSATEQRRRSKINDRFQMLRELIPHSDQKRDKASFLLEVIEYIQFLQEKVQKYEGSYQGWNHEPEKLMPWRNNHRPTESYVDQSRVINSGSAPALVFTGKFDEKTVSVSPTITGSAQHPVESDVSTVTTFKQMDHHPGITNKAMPFPMPLHSNFFTPVRTSAAVPELPPKLVSDGKDIPSLPPPQICQVRSCTTDGTATSDKLKEQELTVEGGTISISSVYSQGLLSTLTQALQSSGVDLSQASISVQIELGKRSNSRVTGSPSIVKDKHVPGSNQGTTRSRVVSAEDSEKALKKPKTGKS